MLTLIAIVALWAVGVLVGSRWGVSLRRGVYRRRNRSKKYSNRG